MGRGGEDMIEKWDEERLGFAVVLMVGLDLRNEDLGKGERGFVAGWERIVLMSKEDISGGS